MSPCLIKRLTPDGLKAVDYQAESLADATQYEPREGVYTVTNTYNTFQVLRFGAHLDRLGDSARYEQIPLQLDRSNLRAALREMIVEAGYGDVRFRITIPREHPDEAIISMEPFKRPPREVYEQGVRCITLAADIARHNPVAKTTGWMHDRDQYPLPEGIYTGLLVDSDGQILEGTTSNFYAVLNGELRTAGAGVLPGTAQQIIFAIADEILPLRKDAVNVADIPRLDEAFVTSSSRGIVPVVEIDAVTLGAGEPGPKTRALMARYADWVQDNLEDL